MMKYMISASMLLLLESVCHSKLPMSTEDKGVALTKEAMKKRMRVFEGISVEAVVSRMGPPSEFLTLGPIQLWIYVYRNAVGCVWIADRQVIAARFDHKLLQEMKLHEILEAYRFPSDPIP